LALIIRECIFSRIIDMQVPNLYAMISLQKTLLRD
jgi:hypothetical protein